MRNLMIFAAVLVALGGFMGQFADRIAPALASSNAKPQKAETATVAQAAPRSLSIPRDARGHFQTDGRIDGQRVAFMVDTGASLVILRETDAANAGMRPMPRDYTATVSTANGKIKAAPAKIGRIEVGGITVYDVPALVLPDDVLSQNLLGVSFLSRLKRYEYAAGRLVLEQ